MSQILNRLPDKYGQNILCSYQNRTSTVQIIRITNIPHWYFERVVFPGQRLVFEAVSRGILEIHSGMMASAILSDSIPCHRLAIQDSPEVPIREAKTQSSQSSMNNGFSSINKKVTKSSTSTIEV